MTFSVVVKEDCATCQLVIPVIEQIKRNLKLLIYCQDNAKFPANLSVVDDRTLEYSWQSRIETVPTLIKFDVEGREVGRAHAEAVGPCSPERRDAAQAAGGAGSFGRGHSRSQGTARCIVEDLRVGLDWVGGPDHPGYSTK